MGKLALLKKKSPNVFKKFMQHIKELLEKLKLLHADTHTTNDYSAKLNEMTDVLEKFYELFENMAVDAVRNFEAAEGNVEAAQSEVRYSEKDFPIDRAVQDIVRNSLTTKKESQMRTLGFISQEENKGINRLSNRTNNDHYRGKYTNGKHLISDNAIRHMMAEHGDFLRESLRAQLPLKENDIARTLSAIKDNRVPKSLDHSRTRRGNPSIITSFEINGYTLYAEEITRSLSKNLPSDLIGHTMYKAPTLATAAVSTTSVATLPKRQSEVLCDYYMPKSSNMSSDYFVSDKNGKPALLTFPEKQGVPVSDLLNGGLIALSSNSNNLSGNLSQGYVRCKKPFYITANNRVFSNSDTNVSERIKALKDQGYDCFIFDYETGDNHFVAVVNKGQIVDPQNMVGTSFKGKIKKQAKKSQKDADNLKGKAVKPISVPGTNKTLSQSFVDDTLNSFGIEILGDYEQVQKQVFKTLLEEGFFTDTESRLRIDTNEETGMVVETNKSGIVETFCLENYGRLGRFKKAVKLATIRELPNAIKHGHLIRDDAPNEHGKNIGTKFAYFKYDTQVDGIDVTIKITVKKSVQKNKFWVHSFEAIKNVSGTPADTNEGIKTGSLLADIETMVSQDDPKVKQKKKTSNRTILADTLESTIDTSTQEGKNELIMLQKYQADIGTPAALTDWFSIKSPQVALSVRVSLSPTVVLTLTFTVTV